jgi:hypothetical protein
LTEKSIKTLETSKILEPIKKANIIDMGNVLLDIDTQTFTLKAGGKLAFWESNKMEISTVIARLGLKALSKDELKKKAEKVAQFVNTNESVRGPIADIAGGDLGIYFKGHQDLGRAHLHHNGNIYELTDNQWNEIANIAVQNLGKQFATAKNISFDSFIVASKIVANVT